MSEQIDPTTGLSDSVKTHNPTLKSERKASFLEEISNNVPSGNGRVANLGKYMNTNTLDTQLTGDGYMENILVDAFTDPSLLDYGRAKSQPVLDQFGNFVTQAVVGEVGLGTLEGLGYLWDGVGMIGDKLAGRETEWDSLNALSQWASDQKEELRQNFEILQKDPGSFNMADTGWWFGNGVSVASTLSLMIPATGVMKGLSLLGRGLNRIGRLAKLTNNISKGVRGGANVLTQAAVSRHMENMMEASQTFKGTYEEALRTINPETGTNFTEEEARAIASDAASSNYNGGWAMLGQDILQYAMATKILSKAGKVRAAKEKLAGSRKDIVDNLADTSKKVGTDSDKVSKVLGKAKTGFKKAYKNPYVNTFASEGFEEGYQYVLSEESNYNAFRKMGIDDSSTFIQRMSDYVRDPEMLSAMFFGGFGGGVFNALQSGVQKYDDIRNAKKFQELYGTTMEKFKKANYKELVDMSTKLSEAEEGQDGASYAALQEDFINNMATAAVSGGQQKVQNFKTFFENIQDMSEEQIAEMAVEVGMDQAGSLTELKKNATKAIEAIDAVNINLQKAMLKKSIAANPRYAIIQARQMFEHSKYNKKASEAQVKLDDLLSNNELYNSLTSNQQELLLAEIEKDVLTSSKYASVAMGLADGANQMYDSLIEHYKKTVDGWKNNLTKSSEKVTELKKQVSESLEEDTTDYDNKINQLKGDVDITKAISERAFAQLQASTSLDLANAVENPEVQTDITSTNLKEAVKNAETVDEVEDIENTAKAEIQAVKDNPNIPPESEMQHIDPFKAVRSSAETKKRKLAKSESENNQTEANVKNSVKTDGTSNSSEDTFVPDNAEQTNEDKASFSFDNLSDSNADRKSKDASIKAGKSETVKAIASGLITDKTVVTVTVNPTIESREAAKAKPTVDRILKKFDSAEEMYLAMWHDPEGTKAYVNQFDIEHPGYNSPYDALVAYVYNVNMTADFKNDGNSVLKDSLFPVNPNYGDAAASLDMRLFALAGRDVDYKVKAFYGTSIAQGVDSDGNPINDPVMEILNESPQDVNGYIYDNLLFTDGNGRYRTVKGKKPTKISTKSVVKGKIFLKYKTPWGKVMPIKLNTPLLSEQDVEFAMNLIRGIVTSTDKNAALMTDELKEMGRTLGIPESILNEPIINVLNEIVYNGKPDSNVSNFLAVYPKQKTVSIFSRGSINREIKPSELSKHETEIREVLGRLRRNVNIKRLNKGKTAREYVDYLLDNKILNTDVRKTDNGTIFNITNSKMYLGDRQAESTKPKSTPEKVTKSTVSKVASEKTAQILKDHSNDANKLQEELSSHVKDLASEMETIKAKEELNQNDERILKGLEREIEVINGFLESPDNSASQSDVEQLVAMTNKPVAQLTIDEVIANLTSDPDLKLKGFEVENVSMMNGNAHIKFKKVKDADTIHFRKMIVNPAQGDILLDLASVSSRVKSKSSPMKGVNLDYDIEGGKIVPLKVTVKLNDQSESTITFPDNIVAKIKPVEKLSNIKSQVTKLYNSEIAKTDTAPKPVKKSPMEMLGMKPIDKEEFSRNQAEDNKTDSKPKVIKGGKVSKETPNINRVLSSQEQNFKTQLELALSVGNENAAKFFTQELEKLGNKVDILNDTVKVCKVS
jgi:hypothetical protein